MIPKGTNHEYETRVSANLTASAAAVSPLLVPAAVSPLLVMAVRAALDIVTRAIILMRALSSDKVLATAVGLALGMFLPNANVTTLMDSVSLPGV